MKNAEFNINQFYNPNYKYDSSILDCQGAFEFHKSIPGYSLSSLFKLDTLASEIGVKEIFIKDESTRFGLNAFKALGASYAVHCWMKKNANNVKNADLVLTTATDGNHGRAVAWTAKKLGAKALIYVPFNTVSSRIESIKSEGAEVIRVDSHYDDTVIRCADDAKKNNWQVISDTAYPGYVEIPGWIMGGYTSIFKEIEQQSDLHSPQIPNVDFVFLQAGVGGLAAAATAYYLNRYGNKRPKLICVEPVDADCLLESIKSKDGEIRSSFGKQNSIMAGLNCGTPSMLAWPIIREGMHSFLSIEDEDAKKAMKILARPLGHDPKIISGESGGAGLGGLTIMMKNAAMKDYCHQIELTTESRVLLINTEGDTDPINYKKIVNQAGLK